MHGISPELENVMLIAVIRSLNDNVMTTLRRSFPCKGE